MNLPIQYTPCSSFTTQAIPAAPLQRNRNPQHGRSNRQASSQRLAHRTTRRSRRRRRRSRRAASRVGATRRLRNLDAKLSRREHGPANRGGHHARRGGAGRTAGPRRPRRSGAPRPIGPPGPRRVGTPAGAPPLGPGPAHPGARAGPLAPLPVVRPERPPAGPWPAGWSPGCRPRLGRPVRV